MKYSGYKRHESVKDCFPFMPFRGPGPYLFRQRQLQRKVGKFGETTKVIIFECTLDLN
jgi:hypothetical protein